LCLGSDTVIIRGTQYGAHSRRFNVGFTTVTVICEGSLEEEIDFVSDEELGVFLRKQAEDAKHYQLSFEIYLLYHPHARGVSCECAQYKQDHNPDLVFTGDDQ
jgi:hypothetical protein